MTHHRIVGPGVEAVVSARAAALRLLRVDGRHLVEPTIEASAPPGMSGVILAPWPNRVEDARWWHDGREQHLDVTEPELGHANHGLLAETDFRLTRTRAGSVELAATVHEPPGYPFRLELRVRYRVVRGGVAVRVGVLNTGTKPAPVALGAHPYLRVGDAAPESLRLRVEADIAYRLDARHIPREPFAVAGSAWDLRRPRSVLEIPGHATFGRLRGRGSLRHTVRAPDGSGVELRADPAFRWTQVYLAADFPADDGSHLALAVEPMTAPPNALRSGTGLRLVGPGRSWRAGFGIRARHGWSRDR